MFVKMLGGILSYKCRLQESCVVEFGDSRLEVRATS